MSDFLHLHVHSQYSLLDGSCRFEDVMKRCKDYGMDAVALTDHGNMYGAIEFYDKAVSSGVKPIVGCEVYQAPRTRFDRTHKLDDSAHHLVLLAKDKTGYQNLLKLVSLADKEGFYYKPRVDEELLSRYSEGLIALSACLAGKLPSYILKEDNKGLNDSLVAFIDIFGKDNFYIELQNNGIPEQYIANKGLIKLAKDNDLKLVATNDVHYIDRKSAYAHDVLLCVQTQNVISETKRLKFGTSEFYFKSPDEMKELFKECPQAVTNTLEIASKCNLKLELENFNFPDFTVPEGFTLETYLEKIARENLPKRYSVITSDIEERLKYELGVITSKGFSAYFLIVWDFINYSKENGIPVGPGRGSAAGSLVAYTLGITDLDPLKYGLIFERFLNPERVSLPDIDIDFCYSRRSEVIKYVTEKYGSDKVSKIITFGRMKARAAIRDVGRVLGIPLSEVDKLAKLIPQKMNIDQAMKTPELAQMYKEKPQAREIIDVALQLEGIARNSSIHAAGIVIGKERLDNYVPIQRDKEKHDESVATYEMMFIEKIGLLKMDFLGLKNLTVIDLTVKLIKKLRDITLDITKLPFDDKKTFELLKDANTVGIFQLESSGMRRYLKLLRPDRFEDIIAMVALYRPGPMDNIDSFVARKHGREKAEYFHPTLEPILKETYGIVVYQEQVMQVANVLAGYSMAEADILRKAMGKKKPEVMAKQRDSFVLGCEKKQVSTKVASKIWDFIEKFAGYGFNKSHAAAYAYVAYQTAYLKANFPKEYMAALITIFMDSFDKIIPFIQECRRMNIDILAPHINESYADFTVVENGIRFGLAAIKNSGRAAVLHIINVRKDSGEFKSLFDLTKRCDSRMVNKKILESLIKSGALDSFGKTRATLMASLESAMEYGHNMQKEEESGQYSLFDEGFVEMEDAFLPEYIDMEEILKKDLLASEKELLGMYVSAHPLDACEKIINETTCITIQELAQLKGKEEVVVAGMFVNSRKIITKNNKVMIFGRLEDVCGSCELVIFPKVYEKFSSLLEDDALLAVKGRVEIESNDSSTSEETEESEVEIKIIASEVFPLDSKLKNLYPKKKEIHGDIGTLNSYSFSNKTNSYLRGVHIKLNCEKFGNLKDLRELLNCYSGDEKVFLHIETDSVKTSIAAGDALSVNCCKEFNEKIESLVGKGNIWYHN